MITSKRIAWLSRHSPTASQIAELQRLFPGCEIAQESQIWGSVDNLLRIYHGLQADEMVAVLPMSIIKLLVDRGVHPLWAQMREVGPDDDADVVDYVRKSDGIKRRFRFVRFMRIVSVDVKMEPVEARKPREGRGQKEVNP